MSSVTVIKRNPQGQETWRYTGKILRREDNSVLLEALFNRSDLPFHGIVLKEGDRFVEHYYNDRWYNIFEIHDREDDRLKAWYCNVGEPAQIDGDVVSYVDLALDLLVFPDGRQLVLDEDEFEQLGLPPEAASQARAALKELQRLFKNREGPRQFAGE